MDATAETARASSRMARAASAPATGSRHARMTASAPPSAYARAVSNPTPQLAPVTTATRPRRLSLLFRTTSLAVERLEKPLGPRQPARWPTGQHPACLRSNARAGDSRGLFAGRGMRADGRRSETLPTVCVRLSEVYFLFSTERGPQRGRHEPRLVRVRSPHGGVTHERPPSLERGGGNSVEVTPRAVQRG